jgi:carbamoylphosphate synthase large subunit
MRHVVFTAPVLNTNAVPTIRTIVSVPDTRVTIISQDPETKLPVEVRQHLRAFYQVENALDELQLLAQAQTILRTSGRIDRMFAANEQVQVPVAVVREHLGIPGMPAETMRNFRDKARMKSLLMQHDVPCARFHLAVQQQETLEFIRQVGYPVIVKPPDGAGAEFTFKIESDTQLSQALRQHPPTVDNPLLIEEFVTGEEFSFDAFTIDGEPRWHSVTKYLPTPLEVKRNAWIQWRAVIPREVDDPQYDGIRSAAFAALRVLGAQTGISHMEWFKKPGGGVAISEVGMRPPGAQFTTLMSRASDFDCMGAWARLMIIGEFTPPVRKYAAGCAYLRGQGEGVVRQVHGFDQIHADLGTMITDVRLPEYGQKPTGSYEGEGYVIVRHPDTSAVEDALLHIVSTIRVVLG